LGRLEPISPLPVDPLLQIDVVAVHDIEDFEDAWVYKSKARLNPDDYRRRRGPQEIADALRKGSIAPLDSILESEEQRNLAQAGQSKNLTPRPLGDGVQPRQHNEVISQDRQQKSGTNEGDVFPDWGINDKKDKRTKAGVGEVQDEKEDKPADDDFGVRGTATTKKSKKGKKDAAEEGRLSHSDAGSGRPSADFRSVHWLRDADMLSAAIPNVRVLLYSYRSPPSLDKDVSAVDYLNQTAGDLISSLQKNRPSGQHDNVPIIFVGHGFGCLVLLKAINSMDKHVSEQNNDNSQKKKDDSSNSTQREDSEQNGDDSKHQEADPEQKEDDPKQKEANSKQREDESEHNRSDSTQNKDENQIRNVTAGIILLDAPVRKAELRILILSISLSFSLSKSRPASVASGKLSRLDG
jgi:hypothetical protein